MSQGCLLSPDPIASLFGFLSGLSNQRNLPFKKPFYLKPSFKTLKKTPPLNIYTCRRCIHPKCTAQWIFINWTHPSRSRNRLCAASWMSCLFPLPVPTWFPHQGKLKSQLKITLFSLSSFCFLYKQNHALFMLLYLDPLAQCAICTVHEFLVRSLARPSCLRHHVSFYEYTAICLSSLLWVGSFQICFPSTYLPSMQII